jgi:hypothetical protein
MEINVSVFSDCANVIARCQGFKKTVKTIALTIEWFAIDRHSLGTSLYSRKPIG